MKKLIAVPVAMLVCAGAFGQGQIAYQNNSSTKVTLNGVAPTAASGVDIEEFYQIDSGGAAPAALTASGPLGNWIALPVTGIIAAGSGLFNGGTQTINTLNVGNTGSGQLVWLDVIGWNNVGAGATTYALSQSLSSAFGSSAVFAYTTGNPNAQPTPTTAPAITSSGFTSLPIVTTPEPATIALGAIGAASLFLFRRRK